MFFKALKRSSPNKRAKPAQADTETPPFGFGIFRFELPIKATADELVISLAHKNTLHLSKIALNIHGKWVNVYKLPIKEATLSSTNRNLARFGIENWLNQKTSFFSTKREKSPYLRISLHKSLEITGVRIENRRDGLWERANNLLVKLTNTQNSTSLSLKLADDQTRLQVYNHLLNELKLFTLGESVNITERQTSLINAHVSDDFFRSPSVHSLGQHLSHVVDKLCFDTEIDNALLAHYLKTLSAFCYFSGTKDDLNFALLNLFIAAMDPTAKEASEAAFRVIQDRPQPDLAVVKSKLKEFGLARYGYPFVIGPHVVARSLRSWPKGLLLQTINRLIQSTTATGLGQGIICYGTLLGLYRDGDFIEHDDDIDLLFIFDPSIAKDKDLVESGHIEVLVTAIKEAGFRVKVSRVNEPNFYPFLQVFDSAHSVHVDLFLAYGDKEKVDLPMQNVKYKEVPGNVIIPTQQWNYLGRTLNVPNDIENFLEYRYGRTWNIPDAFFRQNE